MRGGGTVTGGETGGGGERGTVIGGDRGGEREGG